MLYIHFLYDKVCHLQCWHNDIETLECISQSVTFNRWWWYISLNDLIRNWTHLVCNPIVHVTYSRVLCLFSYAITARHTTGWNHLDLYILSLTLEMKINIWHSLFQGWGKGVVFVNGVNLGRYWSIGPQQTLYIPAPLLKTGVNKVTYHIYISSL